MKQSYLLSVLIASLRNNIKVISESKHDAFVVDLVISNYRSISDGMFEISNKDDEDRFIVVGFFNSLFAKSREYEVRHIRKFSKEQYIADIRKMIDDIIDNAARKGFCMSEEENSDDSAEAVEDVPAPAGTDETPGGAKMPPQYSQMDAAKVLKKLRSIERSVQTLIAELEEININTNIKK